MRGHPRSRRYVPRHFAHQVRLALRRLGKQCNYQIFESNQTDFDITVFRVADFSCDCRMALLWRTLDTSTFILPATDGPPMNLRSRRIKLVILYFQFFDFSFGSMAAMRLIRTEA